MTRRAGGLILLLVACAALGGCQTLMRRSPPALPAPPVGAKPGPPKPAAAPTPVAGSPQPAPKSCVPRTLAPPPRYPDTDPALLAAAGAADRYQLMAAGRLLRQQRLQDLEKVIAACR